MKRVHQLLGLSVLLLLAGCNSSTTKTSGGDPLFLPYSEQANRTSERENGIDIEEDLAKRSEREQNLLSNVHRFYKNLHTLKMSVDLSVKGEGLNYAKKQQNQEQYKEGALQRYLSDTTVTVDGETYQQSFYMQEVENKDKPEEPLQELHTKVANGKWEHISNARSQTVYLYFIKLLLESQGELEFDDGLGQPYVSKKIASPDQLELLATFMDLPVLLTPNASYDMTMTFQIDEEKGGILSAALEGTVEDLGKKYDLRLLARPEVDDNLKEVAVNLKEEGASVEYSYETLLDTFKKQNNLKTVLFYETFVNEVNGEENNASVVLSNIVNSTPFIGIGAVVAEQQMKDYSVIYNGKKYGESSDKKVAATDFALQHYYLDFVNRFVEQYESLREIEQTAEEGKEVETLLFREQYEGDFEAYAQAAGKFDVSRIQRDEEALYAIDYVVNKKTLKLQSVYFWSATASDESISRVTVLQFSKFNEYNPNSIASNVPDGIWKEVK